MAKRRDITGCQFHRLTVLARSGSSPTSERLWECRCECGRLVLTTTFKLSSGLKKSCGCLARDERSARSTKHGYSGHDLYQIWVTMRHRCESPKNKSYSMYGGSGIRVCERWRNSIEAFIQDMGPRPSKSHTIDRVDSRGDYEPGNCRWATAKEQARNISTNKIITYKGKTQCLAAWAEELGVRYGALQLRFHKGWSLERAMTQPFRRSGA